MHPQGKCKPETHPRREVDLAVSGVDAPRKGRSQRPGLLTAGARLCDLRDGQTQETGSRSVVA